MRLKTLRFLWLAFWLAPEVIFEKGQFPGISVGKVNSEFILKEPVIFVAWWVNMNCFQHWVLPPHSKSRVAKGKEPLSLGRWNVSHVHSRIRGFFSDWKVPQTLSKPDVQISTGLEAQSLREIICGHIRILIEIESMTHGIKTSSL